MAREDYRYEGWRARERGDRPDRWGRSDWSRDEEDFGRGREGSRRYEGWGGGYGRGREGSYAGGYGSELPRGSAGPGRGDWERERESWGGYGAGYGGYGYAGGSRPYGGEYGGGYRGESSGRGEYSPWNRGPQGGYGGGETGGYARGGYGGYGPSREFNEGGWGGYQGPGAGRGTSYAGRGPKGYQRSDERVREDVNEELKRHPGLDAEDIEVRVERGEVTLTGTVPERRMKRMAEECAEACSGVDDVHNQLRVKKENESWGAASRPEGGAERARTQANKSNS